MNTYDIQLKFAATVTTMKKIFTVGISGVTCGGKSSLVKRLTVALEEAGFKTRSLHQDEFYLETNCLTFIHELGYHNWDEPKSIDFVKIARSHQELVLAGQCDVILVEGNVIFADASLEWRFDLKYFIRGEYTRYDVTNFSIIQITTFLQ